MRLSPLSFRPFCAVLASLITNYSIAHAEPREISSNITVADQLRTRTGEAGLSRLDENIIGVVTALPAWQDSEMKLRINQITLNSGIPKAGALLGTPGALAAPEQNTQGTALQLEIVSPRHLYLQLGTTPLGYAIEDVTGAVFWRHDSGAQQFKVGAEHRAVTDSVLSYAGTHDPSTGQLWGGVRQSRLRLAWSTGFAGWGLYAGGGISRFGGRHVADNRNWEISLGNYHLPVTHPLATVVLATNFTAFSYEHNQALFTLGHGGYFSPQTFKRAGISASVEGHLNNFSYFAQADIGSQKVHEDSAAWFPLDPSLGNQTSGASSSLQLGSSGRISGEYMLGKNGSVGISATLNHVNTFTESTLQAYLHYSFAEKKDTAFAPPRPAMGRDLFNDL